MQLFFLENLTQMIFHEVLADFGIGFVEDLAAVGQRVQRSLQAPDVGTDARGDAL